MRANTSSHFVYITQMYEYINKSVEIMLNLIIDWSSTKKEYVIQRYNTQASFLLFETFVLNRLHFRSTNVVTLLFVFSFLTCDIVHLHVSNLSKSHVLVNLIAQRILS